MSLQSVQGGAASLAGSTHTTLLRCARPGCFWYEPVDLLRKLALTSLLQFVERGTAMQVPFFRSYTLHAETAQLRRWLTTLALPLQVLCGTSLAVASFGMPLHHACAVPAAGGQPAQGGAR